MNNFASNTQAKNIKAEDHINAIPKEFAYGLASLFLVISILFIYLWDKAKKRHNFYLEVYNNDLRATSISDRSKNIPKFYDNKVLEKYPLPNFRIRYMHQIYLYSSIIFILFSLTLFIGKPLGIM